MLQGSSLTFAQQYSSYTAGLQQKQQQWRVQGQYEQQARRHLQQ
jgi:hypothetical protein